MCIVALFTIAKIWKQFKCPLIDEWIKKMRYTHTHTHTHTSEYYSAIKNEKILPFAATWMGLECMMLTKSEKEKYHMISFICGI